MKTFFYIVLTILTLIGIGWFILWGFSKLSSQWLPFIAAGIGFLVSRFYEAWKENKTRLHEKKREVYTQLLRPWQDVLIETLKADKAKEKLSPEIIRQLSYAAFDTILYASDDVIRDYGKFRTVSNELNVTPMLILGRFTRVLRSVRKDLGNTYSTLTEIEILQMFMNLTPEDKTNFERISARLK